MLAWEWNWYGFAVAFIRIDLTDLALGWALAGWVLTMLLHELVTAAEGGAKRVGNSPS